jgi:hypothetical protein
VRPEEKHKKIFDKKSKKSLFALIYRGDQIPDDWRLDQFTERERGGVTQSHHLSLIYRGDVDEVRDSGEEEPGWGARSLLAPMSLWLLPCIIFSYAYGCP